MNIWESISGVLFSVFSSVVSLFPDVDTASLTTFTSNMDNIRSFLSDASWMVPINTLFFVIGFVLTIETTVLLYKLTSRIVSILSLSNIKL